MIIHVAYYNTSTSQNFYQFIPTRKPSREEETYARTHANATLVVVTRNTNTFTSMCTPIAHSKFRMDDLYI